MSTLYDALKEHCGLIALRLAAKNLGDESVRELFFGKIQINIYHYSQTLLNFKFVVFVVWIYW